MAAPMQVIPCYHPSVTYHVDDPIENLRLKVTLRKRGTATRADAPEKAKPRTGRRAEEDEENADAAAARDDPAGGSRGARTGAEAPLLPATMGAEAEEDDEVIAEETFRWQRKVFGPHEVRAIRHATGEDGAERSSSWFGSLFARSDPQSFVHTQQREQLAKIDRELEERGEARETGHVLHTRIHTERVADDMTEWGVRFTSSPDEEVTPLARAVLSGAGAREHRDLLGEAACVTMSIMAELPASQLGLGRPSRTPMGRLGRASELVDAMLYLCSDNASYVAGVTLQVDGGYMSWGAASDAYAGPIDDGLVPS